MAVCGYRTGTIWDPTRTNWQNTGERPIAWSAWYPAADPAKNNPLSKPFFEPGDISPDAALFARGELPVVLLSHGTGGTAESLGWLARALAGTGHVVLGANHHGNTGYEPYLAEGFLCWWERATDLSVLLSSLNGDGFFANRLNLNHVAAVGFSLGAYTVLALAGAQTSWDEFLTWRRANNITEGGPREFPDAAKQIPNLTKTSGAFRRSWARHEEDFTDERIKSVVAIAPPSPVRSFLSSSISGIDLPVSIITGGADLEAPAEHCADWLVAQNSGFNRHDLGENVGHYTFLDFAFDKSLMGSLEIFTDHESVDRSQVHDEAAKIVIEHIGGV